MKDLMIDLETWGTEPGCAVRSIGAAVFDRGTGEIGNTFYRNIDTLSCLFAGLRMSRSTYDWWQRQPDEARAALDSEKMPLSVVVEQFDHWLRGLPLTSSALNVWSHGAAFDLPIWEAAARAVGAPPGWKFWNHRDTRTLFDVASFDWGGAARDGTHHNALDDARHQAACVCRAIAKLNNHEQREAT